MQLPPVQHHDVPNPSIAAVLVMGSLTGLLRLLDMARSLTVRVSSTIRERLPDVAPLLATATSDGEA